MNIPWEIWVIAAESIVIVLLLVWLIVASAKQKNKNEIRAHVAEQSRDDRLRTALGNTYATEEIRDTAARNVPFQVDYHDAAENTKNRISVQLIVSGPLSTQKYIYNIHDLIRIGADMQNEVVLKETQSVSCDVQLINDQQELYVKKAMANSQAYFTRDQKRYRLDEKMLKVRSGDMLVVGKTSREIQIVNV